MPATSDAPKATLSESHRAWLKKIGVVLNVNATFGQPVPSSSTSAAGPAQSTGLNTTQPGPTSGKATTQSTTAENPSVAGKPIVKKGSKGQDVKDAQTLLNKRGATLKVDGDFGSLTETAVKEFQKKNPPLAA